VRKISIILKLMFIIISLISLIIVLYIKIYFYITYIETIKKHFYIAKFKSTLIRAGIPRIIANIFVEDYKDSINREIRLYKNLLSIKRIIYEVIRLS